MAAVMEGEGGRQRRQVQAIWSTDHLSQGQRLKYQTQNLVRSSLQIAKQLIEKKKQRTEMKSHAAFGPMRSRLWVRAVLVPADGRGLPELLFVARLITADGGLLSGQSCDLEGALGEGVTLLWRDWSQLCCFHNQHTDPNPALISCISISETTVRDLT